MTTSLLALALLALETPAQDPKITLARAQLKLSLAQLDLMAYRAQESITNSKLIELSKAIAVAEKAYLDAVASAAKEQGKTMPCEADLEQDLKCAEVKK